MTKQATLITLTTQQQGILESWMRASTTQQRLVQRSRIVLMAAKGMRTDASHCEGSWHSNSYGK